MRILAAFLLLLVGAARAGELEDARALLASSRARDQLAAIRRLSAIDSKGSIDALAWAIQRSGASLKQLGKRLDRNDLAWERAFDKKTDLEERGKYGTDPYRKASFKQGQLEKEWEALNREARLHLDVLHAAGDAMQQFRSEGAAAALERGARGHPLSLVRMLYIGALGYTQRASSLETLTELVSSDKDPRARAQAVRALVGWAPKGWEIAVAAAQDECWAVRLGAIEAIAHAPTEIAIPQLIEVAGRETGELQLAAFAYLRGIAETRIEDSHRAWKEWWSTHAEEVRAGTYEPPEATPPKPGTRTYARFFHIPIESTNVVFVIDFSGSMREPLRFDSGRTARVLAEFRLRPTRLGHAAAEVIAAIRELPDGARFNVVVFSDTAHRLFRRPLIASGKTRAKAEQAVLKARMGVLTNIWDALNIAFSDYLAGSGGATRFSDVPDTLLFLTDGNPTRGRFRRTGALRKLIELWNQPLDVVIHCVGIGADQDRDLLKGLAEATGGYYVDLKRGVEDLPPRSR